MYRIIQKRKIWFTISGTLVVLAIASLAVFGLNFGIDFKGGSLLEVKFNTERPEVKIVEQNLASLNLESLVIQKSGEDGLILRFTNTEEGTHKAILENLQKLASPALEATSTIEAAIQKNLEELRFDSVGPSIGQELKSKSISAIIWVLIAILLFIAWAFRKISKPIESWKYGLAAVIALFHDVLITIGAFAILGKFFGIEINTTFIAAILTVLGYSVNDTIVVFDRLRENLPKSATNFEDTVNLSINQTLSRSINTSFTVLLVLLAIFFFGGASIQDFALALIIGIFVGTYSSIFLASPLLVIIEKFKK